MRFIDAWRQDARYALRRLRRAPGFAAGAIGILALGIAGTTTVFSYIDALFLQPLPVRDPSSLVRIYEVRRPTDGASPTGVTTADPVTMSYPTYIDIRDETRSFSGVAAHAPEPVDMTVGNRTQPVQGALVSGNYFNVLGIIAFMGRVLTDADDQVTGGHPVAVISHRLWQQQFGSDPAIVGREVRLNGHVFTIVGVASPGFGGSYTTFPNDVWTTLAMYGEVRPRGILITQRGWGWLSVDGRLASGVTIEAAQTDVSILARRLTGQAIPNLADDFDLRVMPATTMSQPLADGTRAILLLLETLAGLLLVVACANLGAVLLARSMGRQREMAIRRAAGAGRGRLMAQTMTECLTLSLLGGAAGVALTVWLANLASVIRPPMLAGFAPAPQLSPRVMAFSLMASLVSMLIVAAAQLVYLLHADPMTALRQEPGSGSIRGHRFGSANALVGVQVAVSVLLLVVSGLLVRSVRETETFSPGFRTDRLAVASFELNRYGYDENRGRAFYAQLLERVAALPGVEEATLASVVPLGSRRESRRFEILGYDAPGDGTAPSIAYTIVGPDYFATMGIRVLAGRAFTAADHDGGSRVVIVNDTMARRFWPAGDAVGRRLGADGPEIVGVVADSKYYDLTELPRPYVFGAFVRSDATSFGSYSPGMSLLLRTTGDPGAVIPAVRDVARALDQGVVATEALSFEELRRTPLFPLRMLALFSSIVAALTLLLTTVGLYGVMSHRVALRRQEMGVRLVLGAPPGELRTMMFWQGMRLVWLGCFVGVLAALGAGGLLASILFGVGPRDVRTLAAAGGLVLLTTGAACYLPARRATRVDPMGTLRAE